MFNKYCILGGCLAEIVFFLYKTGEAMLDAAVRPYIIRAVCEGLTQGEIITTEDGDISNETLNLDSCDYLELLPDLERVVQERSATFIMIYRILVNVPAVALGLFCGAWSDRTGRKLPMMLPSVGSILSVLLYLLGMIVAEHTLLIVMLGAAVQGLLGKSSVITMAVNSYITDTTFQEDRTRKMGKLLAMNFFGMFFGSLLAGALQDVSTLRMTLAVVAVFHGASVLVVFLFMEESIHDKMPSEEGFESDYNKHGLFSLQGLMESLRVVTKPRDGGRQTLVLVAFLAMFLNQSCKVGEQDVTVLFVQKPPLSWKSSGYGYLLSVDYATMGICLLLFLPVLSTFCHLSDITILLLGLLCKLIRTMWAGFCVETWMVYTSSIIGSMAGVITSALRSILSKSVAEDEAGKVFALAASVETAAKLIGSIVFVNIYSASLGFFSGFAYMCCSLVYFFLIVLMVWLYKEVQLYLRHGLDPGLSGIAGDWSTPYYDERSSILPPSNKTTYRFIGKKRNNSTETHSGEGGGGGGGDGGGTGGGTGAWLPIGGTKRTNDMGHGKNSGVSVMPTIVEPNATDVSPMSSSEKEENSLLPLSASETNLTGISAATP